MKFKSNIELQAGLEDNNAASGTTGQVLSSTGTGVEWIDQSALTDVQSNFVYFDVKNETGSTINKGKGVMAVGTDGNSGHILIDEMVADGSVEPKYFLGVLETTVANGGFARVISFGQLDQFDTRGQNGETWSDGQVLWCDPDSAGDFTITEPDGPNVKIAAAIVLNASTNGKIQVRVQANEGIHDLHDTKITSQVDGDVLVWDNTTGVWFNDSTLNVDYTNGRVGIGTTDPVDKLDVRGTARITSPQANDWIVLAQNYATGAKSGFWDSGGNVHLYLRDISSNTNVLIRPNSTSYFNGGNVGIGTTNPAAPLTIANANGGSWNDGLIIDDPTGWAATVYKRNNVPKMFTGLYNGNDNYIWMSSGYNNAGTTITAPRTDAVLMARPATDDLQIYLDTHFGGNVGIGTTSPSAKLDVTGTGTFSGNVTIGGAQNGRRLGVYGVQGWTSGDERAYLNPTSTGVDFYLKGSSSNLGFRVDTRSASTYIAEFDNTSIDFNRNLSVTGTGTFSGNVGIGTTSPSAKLDVAGNVSISNTATARLDISGGGNGYVNAAVSLRTTDDNTNRGNGIYSYNDARGIEWFFGNPYNTSDSFSINRRTSATGYNESTADPSYSIFTVSSNGDLDISGRLLAGNTSLASSHMFYSADDATIRLRGNDNWSGIGFLGNTGTEGFLYHNSAGQFFQMTHQNQMLKGFYVPDNEKGYFGSSNDLEIYHDGTDSYINQAGTGALIHQVGDNDVAYWRGDATAFQFFDNKKISLGNSQDLQLYHNGTNSYIADAGVGELRVLASTFSLRNSGDTELMITAIENGAVNLYHNNVLKLNTTATGVDITGNLDVSGVLRTDEVRTLSAQQLVLNAGESHAYATGQTGEYVYINAEKGLFIASSPDNWATAWANRTTGVMGTLGNSDGKLRLGSNSADNILLIRGGSTKAEITSTGIDVTGDLTVSNSTVAQLYLDSATGNDSAIYHRENSVQVAKTGYDTSEDVWAVVAGGGAFSTAQLKVDTNGVDITGNLDVSGTGTFGDDITIPNNTSVIASNSTGSETSQVIGTTGSNGIVIGQSARWNSTNIYSGGVGYTLEMDSSKNSTFNGNLDVSGTGTLSRGVISSYAIQSSQGVDIGIGGDNDAGVIQSFASKPLFLNPVGNQVQIGSGGLNVSGNLTLNNNKELRFKNTANNAVGVMTLYSDNTLRIFNGNSTSGNIEFRDGSAIGTLNASIRGSDGKFLANFGANITGNLDVSGDVTAQGDTVTLLNENSGNKNINIRKRFDGSSYINWIRSSNTDAYIGVDETENLQIGYASSGLNRDLIFTSNNSEVIRFDRQGNVGIGTASPTSPLTIKSDSVSAQDSGITIQANGSTNDIIRMGEKSTNGGRLHMFDGGVEKIAFYTDGTDNHISAGNVGIGTTTVNAKLHVYSSTADLVSRFESSDALSYIQINDNSDSVYVGTQSGRGFIGGFASLNSSNLNINLTTGNVGIGTTSPDSLLEISSSSATDFLKLTSGGGGANPVKLIFEKSSVEQGIIEYNRNGDLEIYNIDSDGGVMIDGSASGGGDLYVNNAGNVGIGTTSPGEKLEVVGDTFINGQIYGGVGAETTSGTTDWNHSTNARSGNGYTLLRGNATNGPAGSEYYHPFSFEYSAKNGTGNLTQFAIPYSTNNTGMYFRSRYNSTWTGWSEIWTSNNDGADSGLDADLLDGQQGSYYAAASSLSSYLPLAGGTMTGTSGVLFPDNFKLNIGTSSDLQIYHNGSISYIDQTGVGKLILNTLNTGINIQAGSGETRFTKSGINSEIKVDDASQANKIVLKASGNSYLNGGNVGIGTTSPSYKLDVNGGAGVPLRLYSSADQQLLLNSPNSWTGIGFNDGAASGTDYIWHNGVNQTFAIGGGGSNVSGKKLHVHGATTIGSGLAGTAVPTDGLLVQGNVGIGTGAPPEGRFEVQTIDSNRYIRFKAPNGEQRFQFYTGGTGNAAAQFMYNSDGTTRNVQISAGGTSYFNAGNVGIGTTNPNHKLDIYADSNVPLRIHRQSSSLDTTEPVGIGFSHRGDNNTSITDTRAGIFSSYNGDLFLSVDAGGRVDDDPIADAALFIEGTNGNVGIGTTSPSEKLDVVGNIELSGNVINASNTAYYLDLDGTSKLNHGSFSSTLGFGAFTAGTRGTLLEGYSTHSVVRTDSARLDFYMGKTTTGVGTMMSLTDTGKVGIGTTNPSEKLDVIGNIELTQHLKATGGNLSFSAGGNQIMNIDLNGKVYPTTDSAYDLGFSSTLAWRNLYIDNVYANNNVGIGTTSPVFKLDVHNSGSGIRHYGDSNNQLETFCYGSYQTLIATNGSVTNEFGYVGGNFYIQTNDEEKFRITSSGNVGVGTTSPSSRLHVAQTLSSSSVPMVYFEADSSTYTTTNVRVDNVEYGAGMSFYRAATYDNKAIAFINGTTQVGSISINTSSTSYNTTSDYRLKENLTEITDGIERVKQLQPKRFNFIGDTDTVDGFIAHEAQEVVPEAVTGEKDGVLPNGDPIYQGIDQAKLVPLLTAALQEAITKIEQLETRIQTLENK